MHVKLTEKHGIACLALLFLIVSVFVLSFPYATEKPVVPDEKAYYRWAELYSEGKYAVPLEEWYDDFAPLEVYINSTSAYAIDIAYHVDRTGETYNINGCVWLGERGVRTHLSLFVLAEPGTPPKKVAEKNTTSDGLFNFSKLLKGTYMLEISYTESSSTPPVNLTRREIIPAGTPMPYSAFLNITSCENDQITVRNYNILGNPIGNANITVLRKIPGEQPHPVMTLKTDANGTAVIPRTPAIQPGNYVILAQRNGSANGAICSIVEIDGSMYAVNHWPPGYSIILSGFMKLGLVNYVSIFFMALGTTSLYLVCRRMFSWHVGFYAGILFLTCGTAVMLVYARGMGDCATMSLAFTGFALLIEGVYGNHGAHARNLLLFVGGSMFGLSILVRYSTAVVLFMPLALFLTLLYREIKKEKTRKWRGVAHGLLRTLKLATPFVIGILLPGIYIASYNTTYFGSPFNSGYQFPSMGVFTVSDEGNYTAGVSEPESTMFEEYFTPSLDALYNLPNILRWLLLCMPAFFTFPLGMLYKKRDTYAWLLFIYALPVLVIYMQMSWVASWDNPVRAMEDTRYFLPALPALCILTALAFERWEHKNGAETMQIKIPVVAILAMIVISGMLCAFAGINMELERTRMMLLQGAVTPDGSPAPPPQSFLAPLLMFLWLLNLAAIVSCYYIAIWGEKSKRQC